MSKIIDNSSENTLNLALNKAVSTAKSVDICVGYFNVRGWNQIADSLDSVRASQGKEPVRLLVGMAVSEQHSQKKFFEQDFKLEDDVENLDFISAQKRSENAVRDFADQLTWGLPSKSGQAAVRGLLADLKAGTVVIKFAARRRLHAKLYLCHSAGAAEAFTAFVGSSNFTTSGLASSGELNLEETDREKGIELAAWFENHWNDIFSIDVTERLIEVLEQSWAVEPNPSPRSIHLRLAYELSRDARAGEGFEIPDKILERLVPWQEAAAKVGARILQSRGLVVVGDVVGLGKTIVGTAIAAASRERALILCPKNLVNMWKRYVEVYELHARVVPLSMVTRELPEMKHYGVVLIDESHNLRHRTTQAHEAVRNYIHENGSKVILLTATLINSGPTDISGQLSLKLDAMADLGIRPEHHIERLTAEERIKFQEAVEGNTSSIKAFEQSDLADDWRSLLSLFLVRRTRPYLLENYAKVDKDGKKYFEYRDGSVFRFPTRRALPLEYPGGKDDPCDQLVSIENFDALEQMSYARYQLGNYFTENYQPADQVEQAILDDLKRATASKGFIQTTVMKRLASSPKAFFITVEKMLLRAHILRYALLNDLPVPLGSIADKYYESGSDDEDSQLDDFDLPDEVEETEGSWAANLTLGEWEAKAAAAYDALRANKPKDLQLIRVSAFDKTRLLKDVNADNATLQQIIDKHGLWNPANDSKLNKLIELVEGLDSDQKLLVFSEYADSIAYLEKHISNRLPNLKFAAVSGRSNDPTYVARCFSPQSNFGEYGGLPDGETELQVLLATDVLSEGQNLQDAAMILNWDLPWTIIKIIQRAGRVDRVGQKAETIDVYSFKPHNGVEDHIKLVKRLRSRLEINQQILGGGETIFADHFEDSLEDLFDGKAALLGDEGEVDYSSYALGIWNKATELERRQALAVGLGSHSTIDHDIVKNAVMAYAQATKGEDHVFDLLAIHQQGSLVRTLTQMEALKLTEQKQLQSSPDLEDHHDLVASLVKHTLYPQAAQKPLRLISGVRRKLTEFFDRSIGELELDDEIRIMANETHTATLDNALLESGTVFAKQILNKVARGVVSDREGLVELVAFHSDGKLLDTDNQGLRKFELMLSMGFAD